MPDLMMPIQYNDLHLYVEVLVSQWGAVNRMTDAGLVTENAS